MTYRNFITALLLLAAAHGYAATVVNREYDELVKKAVQYGSTAEKRAEKSEARELLFEHPDESLEMLMQYVHLENLSIRVLIDNLVTAMEAEPAGAVLSKFLSSEHVETRKFAAWFLGYHDTPQYAGLLGPLLEEDKTRNAAIRTLGKWKVEERFFTIASFLEHPEERTRVVAVNALRDIGSDDSIPFLRDALEDPFFTVRKAALRAIRVLQEKENVSAE